MFVNKKTKRINEVRSIAPIVSIRKITFVHKVREIMLIFPAMKFLI